MKPLTGKRFVPLDMSLGEEKLAVSTVLSEDP
jgi:hypothetical protein